jgi:hypothetical protein
MAVLHIGGRMMIINNTYLGKGNNMNKVYEVTDGTDYEMYFPLGIFSDRKTALAEIKKADDEKRRISPYSEEYEVIKIFERELGWSGNGTCIITIERERYYDDVAEEYYWRRVV